MKLIYINRQETIEKWKRIQNQAPKDMIPRNKYKKKCVGFPGDLAVKNPPTNAQGTGLTSGPGRSHIAKEQLSTTSTESALLNLNTKTRV